MVIQAARLAPDITCAHCWLSMRPFTTWPWAASVEGPLAVVRLPSAALETRGYTSTTHRLTRVAAEMDT